MLDFFYDDWLDYSCLLDPKAQILYYINLKPSFFDGLDLSYTSIHDYALEAARCCAKPLGNKIALCLSGGVDSQITALAFKEANIPFKAYTLEFNDSLNDFDYEHAKMFCDKNDIEYNPIKFDVVDFLNRKNFDIGMKYKSASPHFNVHYEMFNILKRMGHTGVVCGGVYPLYNHGDWIDTFAQNAMNFVNYSVIENFYAQGSFLSYHPKLAWGLCLVSKPINIIINKPLAMADKNKYYINRYAEKINIFQKIGFDVIGQEMKFTGFEKVKLHYERIYKDGYSFEKMFRWPLDFKFTKVKGPSKVLKLTPEQEESLLSRYSYNVLSGIES